MRVECFSYPGAATPIAAGVLGTFTFQPLATGQASSALNLVDVKMVNMAGDLVTPGPVTANGVVHLVIATDTDGDGCPDAGEWLLVPPTSASNPWDFYSVPVPALFAAPSPLVVFRDNAVGAGDAQAVFAYFRKGARTGTPEYEQDLNLNGVRDGVEYDRTTAGPGQSGPPDGVIGSQDAQLANAQFRLAYRC